ncbi:MAG: hypothetical protein SGJ13_00215 [Actinomycetota bacterium]|nr:hypothetical protein [Actinomycetota bacterium]
MNPADSSTIATTAVVTDEKHRFCATASATFVALGEAQAAGVCDVWTQVAPISWDHTPPLAR